MTADPPVRGHRVRIGFGFGGSTRQTGTYDVGPGGHGLLGSVVADLERLGYDSLWVSERATGQTLDPMVAMAYAAGCTERLKLGPAVLVLPGRNPVLCAKAMASLDRLSGGRLLPAFGLGIADAAEQQAFGVARADRAGWFDEALPLIRRLWTEDVVDHHGPRFHLDGVSVLPKPLQQPLEVWLGGSAASELRRCGRLGDGWLPSFIDPAGVASGIATITEVADDHGRHIEPGHFGALVPFVHRTIPERFAQRLRSRRPQFDLTVVVASVVGGLRVRLDELVSAGASKFVIFPLDEPDDWHATIEDVATEVLHLQS